MSSRKQTRIDASGSLVSDGDEDSSSSRGGILPSMPRQLDVFGFNLEIRQFVIVLALASFMLGANGTLVFIVALGAYTAFQRATASSGSSSSGGGNRGGWSNGRSGATIKGVGDLPKPKSG